MYRTSTADANAAEVHDALKQFAKEAVRGHTQATAAMDGRWAQIRVTNSRRNNTQEEALEEAAADLEL